MGYLRGPHAVEIMRDMDDGLYVLGILTIIILFIIVDVLIKKLPDKLSKKVVNSTPYIFIGVPLIVCIIYELVNN